MSTQLHIRYRAYITADGDHYISWVNRRWREWMDEVGRCRPLTQADHDAFDEWLSRKYGVER